LRQQAGVARFAVDECLPRDQEGLVFEKAWQVEAFALTVRLHEQDVSPGTKWAATLAAVLRVVSTADLDRRKAAWMQAYLSTPHGQPVELPAGLETRRADIGSTEAFLHASAA
jgi:hypothetical protein